jgi:hypothetical protein
LHASKELNDVFARLVLDKKLFWDKSSNDNQIDPAVTWPLARISESLCVEIIAQVFLQTQYYNDEELLKFVGQRSQLPTVHLLPFALFKSIVDSNRAVVNQNEAQNIQERINKIADYMNHNYTYRYGFIETTDGRNIVLKNLDKLAIWPPALLFLKPLFAEVRQFCSDEVDKECGVALIKHENLFNKSQYGKEIIKEFFDGRPSFLAKVKRMKDA